MYLSSPFNFFQRDHANKTQSWHQLHINWCYSHRQVGRWANSKTKRTNYSPHKRLRNFKPGIYIYVPCWWQSWWFNSLNWNHLCKTHLFHSINHIQLFVTRESVWPGFKNGCMFHLWIIKISEESLQRLIFLFSLMTVPKCTASTLGLTWNNHWIALYKIVVYYARNFALNHGYTVSDCRGKQKPIYRWRSVRLQYLQCISNGILQFCTRPSR